MDFLLKLDTSLFIFLNKTLSNPFFDWFMPIATNQHSWNPIYIFLILFLLIKYKKNGAIIVLAMLLTVGLSDLIGSRIIKELVGRLRPCWSIQDIHLLVPCGAGKSFPSLHSSNNFALAFVLSYYFKKNSWIFYTLASIIALSRVFVGVHYPFDIIGGALLGIIYGYLITTIFSKLKYLNIKEKFY